jgi:hypothetical protein
VGKTKRTHYRILNANPNDGVAVMLCLITIWWCVRYVPRGPGPTRFVLAVLGVLAACFGTQMRDAMISAAFLVAAILLEISPRHAGRDDEVLRHSFRLR